MTLDVLSSGADDERPSPFTRRRLAVAAGVALLGLAALGVVQLRALQEERRLDRIVDVAVEVRGSTTGYDSVSRRADLDVQLRLRNQGPRDLVVTRGRLGGYLLPSTSVQLPAGEEIAVLLRKALTCSPTAPPPPDDLSTLALELRTAAGPRSLTVPVETGIGPDEDARACGYLPLEEAAFFTVQQSDFLPEGLALRVEVLSQSDQDVDLTAAQAGPGVSVRATGGSGLPVTLPPRGGGADELTTLVLLLEVTDCAAAAAAPARLVFSVSDDRGRVAQPSADYPPSLLEELLSRDCSGGASRAS